MEKKMVNQDENNQNIFIKPITQILQYDTRSRKFGVEMKRQNMRALGVINQNLVGARAYHCVVNKRRGLSERKQESCEKKKLNSLHPPISRLIKLKALKISFSSDLLLLRSQQRRRSSSSLRSSLRRRLRSSTYVAGRDRRSVVTPSARD